jgi:hypothetical protein
MEFEFYSIELRNEMQIGERKNWDILMKVVLGKKNFKRQIQKDTFPCLNRFQHGIVQVVPKTTTYDL